MSETTTAGETQPGTGTKDPMCVTGRRGHDGVMTGLMGDPQQKGIKGPRRKNSA